MRIAVIIPSRGQIVSKTFEHILNNLTGLEYRIYWAHGLDIPTCFNKPLETALRDSNNTHFWIVEDDMMIPDGTLEEMLDMTEPSIICDYPVTKEGVSHIKKDSNDDIYFCGTGCLLMTREFLNEYKKPIFRSDIAFELRGGLYYATDPNPHAFALHDVLFSMLAYLRGNPIQLCKIKCGQYKLAEEGAVGVNAGVHKLELWDKIKPIEKFSEHKYLAKDSRIYSII